MKALSFRVALLNSLKENKKNVNFHGIMLTSYDWTVKSLETFSSLKKSFDMLNNELLFGSNLLLFMKRGLH